ncbi:hypothetical protein FRUB_05756 [Fimbriiglobus ruber]|uniref:Uncharacterized protein n=1 Tax=Fimbriiglobus ruber TaxID=1908690 RepID=A0A225DQP8_9BACT|nr:hypothetical protein FRUB_05756 [Fimbriiglobus ruber]
MHVLLGGFTVASDSPEGNKHENKKVPLGTLSTAIRKAEG